MIHKLLSVSVFALACAIAYAATPAANAEPAAPSVACEQVIGNSPKSTANKRAEWMTAQIAAGRDEFFSDAGILCAW